jgi:probable rRNA maturation factor
MIEVNNLADIKIGSIPFEEIAEKNLEKEKRKKTDLFVSLVSPAKIKKLNSEYRKKNKPTDVLSFAYKNSLGRSPMGESGEIIICPSVVKNNSKKAREKFENGLVRVFIHGVLHILGYDHEKEEQDAQIMEKKQNYYFNLFLNRK